MGDTSPAGAGPAPASAGAATGQPIKASHAFWWVLGLFVCLVLLAAPGIWFFIPAWYTRLAGNETQGVVYHVRDCGSSDNGDETYQDTIVFRDAQGQLQESTSGHDCASTFANGDTVTLWYLPTLPGTPILSGGYTIVISLLSGVFLILVSLFLFFFVKGAQALIRACVQVEAFAQLWLCGLACLLMVVSLLPLLHFFPPPANQDGDGPTHNFRAGETVAVDGRWAISVQPGRPSAQSAGKMCLELDVTLRNTTHQSQTLAVSQFVLFDGQAKVLKASCSLDAPRLRDTRVPPGGTLTGALAFTVPAGLRECYLAFRPGPPEENTGRYFWRLSVSTVGSSSSSTNVLLLALAAEALAGCAPPAR